MLAHARARLDELLREVTRFHEHAEPVDKAGIVSELAELLCELTADNVGFEYDLAVRGAHS